MAEQKQKHNPRDTYPYTNKLFATNNGSEFYIDFEGKIYGRPKIEGAKIELIAGIEDTDENYDKVFYVIDEKDKVGLDRIIMNEGQKVEKGKNLRLVLSLTEKDATQKGRVGFITSRIDDIF